MEPDRIASGLTFRFISLITRQDNTDGIPYLRNQSPTDWFIALSIGVKI
jgi:hypothetical protein